MALHTPVTDRILGAVQRAHGCDLDTLTNSLSDLSWGQVFLEVDRLSREGQVLMTRETGGRYMIRLPDHNRRGPAPITVGPGQRRSRRGS
jgi:hypothetical protein